MSDSLHTLILVGPQTLSDDVELRRKAVERATRVTNAINAWAELYNDDGDGSAAAGQIPDALQLELKQVGVNIHHEEPRDYNLVLHCSPEGAVAELLETWNKRTWTDVNTRDYGTRQILVAGGVSYGDEPEGVGYQACKRASQLGLLRLYGIK